MSINWRLLKTWLCKCCIFPAFIYYFMFTKCFTLVQKSVFHNLWKYFCSKTIRAYNGDTSHWFIFLNSVYHLHYITTITFNYIGKCCNFAAPVELSDSMIIYLPSTTWSKKCTYWILIFSRIFIIYWKKQIPHHVCYSKIRPLNPR